MTAIVCTIIGANVEQLPDRGVADRIKPRLVHSAAATDAELMAEVCAGDHAAFSEIAQRYFAQVYRVTWRVLGGPADAEDIAQEAFIKLWQSPHSLRDGGAVRPWLMRVATNLAIDRKRRRQPQLVDELPDVADDSPTPEGSLSRSEVSRHVDAAIAGLPDRQKLAIVVQWFDTVR